MKKQRALLHLLACFTLVCIKVVVSEADIKLTHDGPVILGGTITFKADLIYSNGERPSGDFTYTWEDNTLNKHFHETEPTSNTTTYYSATYSHHVGTYTMEVAVCKWFLARVFCREYNSQRVKFSVTSLLNGNLAIEQGNKTVSSEFVSSTESANLSVNLNKGDFDYITKSATNVTTYWFVDCISVNATSNFNLSYHFNNSNTSHTIEALVLASFEPLNTTVAPLTTISTSTKPTFTPTSSVKASNSTSRKTAILSDARTLSTTVSTENVSILENVTYPYVCHSSKLPKPNTTYGYFMREIKVRAPISNLEVKGSTWIQPWDMLFLQVSCNGTGPFRKCIEIHVGQYNVTNNETCNQDAEIIDHCDFSIIHYFLDPLNITVLIIVSNEVSNEIHPVAVNIYEFIPQPQLSVIVVPIFCSLIAVVLIIFGVAYYLQSTSRHTIEVADFDFTQNSIDMEYKTFSERLRDSLKNSGYKHLNEQQEVQ